MLVGVRRGQRERAQAASTSKSLKAQSAAWPEGVPITWRNLLREARKQRLLLRKSDYTACEQLDIAVDRVRSMLRRR